MIHLRALVRDPDDFLVDQDRPYVLARYADHLGTEVAPPVWASDIPDEVWDAAEADEDRAGREECDAGPDQNAPRQ